MKLIDGFSYAGEKQILEIRINELFEIVDYFIIIESNRSQTGLIKPYYFEETQEYFKNFLDKILYIKIDDSNLGKINEADWSQEFSTRQAIISKGLTKLHETIELNNNDYIMVSDVDEIPKASVIKELLNKVDIISINHYFNSYYLNLYSEFRSWGWYGTILMRLGYLNRYNIQYLRNIKDQLPRTGQNGEGWHFSSLLVNSFETLYSKWTNNIEPHNKSCLIDKIKLKNQFEECLYKDSHFFFCDSPLKREIPLKKLDLDLLPEYVKNNPDKFKNLILS